MNISNATKISLVPFIIGNRDLWLLRTSKELVSLFNQFGFRDDIYKDGLPKLNNPKLNTSKKQYVEDRLLKLIDNLLLKKFIEVIINDASKKDEAIRLINEIIVLDNCKITLIDGKYTWEGIDVDQNARNEAIFIDIQNKVIRALEGAKVSILIAMAWFTNENIKEKLLEKLRQGLRIELVIFNDGVNANHGVDLSSFDHVKIRGLRGGFMHHKFCVIDNQIVITGSYNWSTNAEFKNDENVIVTKDNEIATSYSVQFRELKPIEPIR